MGTIRPIIGLALVMLGLAPGGAGAFDRSIERPTDLPCNAFCRTWMGQPEPASAPPISEVSPSAPLALPSAALEAVAPPDLDRPRPVRKRTVRRPPQAPRRDLAVNPRPVTEGWPTPGPGPHRLGPPPDAPRADPVVAARPVETPSGGVAPGDSAGAPLDPVLRSRINWVRALNAGLGHGPLPTDHAPGGERRAIEEDLQQLQGGTP